MVGMVVGVEAIAERNGLQLFRTSRRGQWKAHCPVCKDNRKVFHLYVSGVKDAFICHKCGARGGAVALHAWLKGLSFEEAKAELYPESRRRSGARPVLPLKSFLEEEIRWIASSIHPNQIRSKADLERAVLHRIRLFEGRPYRVSREDQDHIWAVWFEMWEGGILSPVWEKSKLGERRDSDGPLIQTRTEPAEPVGTI